MPQAVNVLDVDCSLNCAMNRTCDVSFFNLKDHFASRESGSLSQHWCKTSVNYRTLSSFSIMSVMSAQRKDLKIYALYEKIVL